MNRLDHLGLVTFRVLSSFVALMLSLGATTAAFADESKSSLVFDPSKFTTRSLTVAGQGVPYRAYEGIVYVAKPVAPKYQRMNIYVPAGYAEGKTINGYTADTAPIFMPNGVGGYMPALPGTPEGNAPSGPASPPSGRPSQVSTISVALSRGYVVAAPGVRGRTLKGDNGEYTGKAPAGIVDLKAAVRYLRFNDKVMPGDANKIVTNGTSAGGAMSALQGATGDAGDYQPYLTSMGAADASDAVFASSCYCPITNLDHADMAYEWEFGGVHDFSFRGRRGTLSPEQQKVSDVLKPLFPAYVNSLNLKRTDGTALTLDTNGNGPLRDEVKALMEASAQRAADQGKDLSALKWIRVENGKVKDLDFDQYVRFILRGKTPPAFDALDLRSPENNLFGTGTIDNQHFTQFSAQHGTDHAMADPAVIRMMNPMNYIGAEGAKTAKHWRIRHGASDRDTSLAIATLLTMKLRNTGYSVDFASPWGVEHSGDYDLDELFAWVDQICR